MYYRAFSYLLGSRPPLHVLKGSFFSRWALKAYLLGLSMLRECCSSRVDVHRWCFITFYFPISSAVLAARRISHTEFLMFRALLSLSFWAIYLIVVSK